MDSPPAPSTDLVELMALAPQALQERLQTLAADFQLAYAKNTLRTWRSDWRVWTAFCAAAGVMVLPASVDSLRAFLVDRIDAGRKRATLEHYLATLSMVHKLIHQPWPLDTMEGRLMWRGLRRTRLHARQRQAKGLTLADRDRVLSSLSDSAPRDVRDAALLSLAYETMCRRSELVALQLEQLSREEDGSGRVLLERSKTDQEGEGEVLFISPATMQRLDRWIDLAALGSGPLFRSIPHIPKHGADVMEQGMERYPTALTDGDVARIFKRRAIAAGLKDAMLISGHSTRVGPAQDLLAKNFSGAAIMRQGRWKSERMVIRYGARITAGQSAMAQMLRVTDPAVDEDSDPSDTAKRDLFRLASKK